MEPSLNVVAAEPVNEIELLPRFDTFGRRRHAETIGQFRHCAHYCVGFGVGSETLDEATVNLDLVERKLRR